MRTPNPGDAPVSHGLTRAHIQVWKNTIYDIKQRIPFAERWPCMYCHSFIDMESLEHRSRFKCQNAECVGKGKWQVTCFWDVKPQKRGSDDLSVSTG
ncbi:hypothetical protein PtrSN002B_002801 [Pyrenophora tritici-repentis]|uniref:Uncharacterized protein n=2 Tax=Pyrenophora tritici-repentis TaxID=45151 RepID=A0A2W1EY49_9PLEO|nr:uncharacterized protein PTRG_03905 [Pyrenophora tritici-repentis Pt-1C-BFP]KAA8620036.1 hypothetical protein PtrV1_07130 [Pyrenophora tritici-repentis]EDU46743.1 predicted protein [Pyrenophora tritici-repentis Pt-1C-BFP]KAF7448190.1 hypothetical protein A1F99_075540 [Pyrenophora tritici-repentis]KAF7571901.1 hypothetical protein PtrM4_094010 [Pyrenophora tritici-repentis]KAG9384908.1 hypothetical protein A1F94_004455 [Pyrenophora tritici-repentis]